MCLTLIQRPAGLLAGLLIGLLLLATPRIAAAQDARFCAAHRSDPSCQHAPSTGVPRAGTSAGTGRQHPVFRPHAPPPPAIPQVYTRPPPEPPTIPTRALVLSNECRDDLQVRLIYRSADGLRQPNGELWTVKANSTTLPLSYHGQVLQLSAPEVYVHVTGPTGAWTWDNPFTGDYNGTQLTMGRANVGTSADGNYLIRFTCPDPPPAAAQAPQARGISIHNACSYRLQVRLVYRTNEGLREPTNGQFWNVEGGERIHLVYSDHTPVQAISDEIYYHISGPNGPFDSPNPQYFDYGNQRLGMALAHTSIDSDGRYQIEFTCN
jgi:hypothetical protein